MMQEIMLLLMLLIANGSPLAARALLGERLKDPIDAGLLLGGRPLFGPSKTWLGLVTAISATALFAPVLGLDWWIGALIGSLAMLGDLVSSFVKRRRGHLSGARAIGLDHLPESLLPLLACIPLLGITLWQVILISLAYVLVNTLTDLVYAWVDPRIRLA